MKKLFLLFFSLYLSISFSYAYQNFDGMYNYNEYNSEKKVNTSFADSNTEVLFIVDFSGSMNKRLGYAPKAFLAIDAIRSILNDTGKTTKIGLRIFGITDRSIYQYTQSGVEYNKHNLCTASELVLPIAKYNNENISDSLSRFKPQGATPIGYSLRQAIQNDFSPNASLKHIILITDGYETCGDDPCLYISRIMQLRNDIKIDVIGITVTDNQYSQLNCIAQASKGKFFAVNSPEDFEVKFRQAFRSTAPVNIVKTPIKINNFVNSFGSIRYKNFAYEFKN